MRTPEVTREFRDKCKELAALSNIPEIKERLLHLVDKYDGLLQEIDPSDTSSIVPVNNQQEG